MEKKQLPRKHVGKILTPDEQETIEAIKESKKLNSWLEAKHEYFENQAKWDAKSDNTVNAIGADAGDVTARLHKMQTTDIADKIANTTPIDTNQIATEYKQKRAKMTIAETKLGVTMVINKEECKQLGIDINKTTKEAIQELRFKLGLKTKGVKK